MLNIEVVTDHGTFKGIVGYRTLEDAANVIAEKLKQSEHYTIVQANNKAVIIKSDLVKFIVISDGDGEVSNEI